MNVSPGARLLGPGDVRVLAGDLGFRPSKQRGQNFVTDGNTIRRIVRAADVHDSDVVLEIGPGLGSLTLGLLAETAADVVAVEVEPALAETLPGTVRRYAPKAADRLQVVTADALRLTDPPGDAAPTVLVANLPYNVAVPVLLRVLERMPTVRRGLVMVQLEVADRLVASPGSKVYGVPSVKARWYADVARAGVVGRAVFWPRPNVDSGLVSFTRHEPPSTSVTRERVFAVVDAAFAQRRKTLRAALAEFAGSAANAEAALLAVGVDPSTRGERLEIADFVRIAEALEEGT